MLKLMALGSPDATDRPLDRAAPRLPAPRDRPFDPVRSMRRLMMAATLCSALLVVGVGGWATTTEITGAIIAQGRLIVESDVKKVQHPTGGVVGELPVREGQHVRAGDVVLRLDRTQSLASLDIIRQSIDELEARQARDRAERDGARTISFPPDLRARRDDPATERLLGEERTLFATRSASREGQKAQLAEQIKQLDGQAGGIRAEIDAKSIERQLNDRETAGVQSLWDQRLVQYTRLAALQREGARLQGEVGRLEAGLAEIKGHVAETKLKILQIDQDTRTDVGRELADIRGRLAELREKEIAARDQLRRLDLKSPQDGFVHELAVHTINGVVNAGETVMLIVPAGDALSVEARIQPSNIDQVHLGQLTTLRFPGLDQRITPEIDGTVSLISADLVTDERGGGSFYTIRITIPLEQLARLGKVKLVPGMPVEAFLQTQARTVLSYLTKPIREQVVRAFRER